MSKKEKLAGVIRTESFRSDAELFTLLLGLKPIVVAETATVHKLSTLLSVHIVVPRQVVAITRALDLRQQAGT